MLDPRSASVESSVCQFVGAHQSSGDASAVSFTTESPKSGSEVAPLPFPVAT